jgi:S-adenosylmethionine:tRNA ribosyltransferase-isomerase
MGLVVKTNDFFFTLPPELIAQHPLEDRTASKMLVYERSTQSTHHDRFANLLDYLKAGDVLVFNDSKVIPARLFGQKATGGQVELLVERLLSPYVFLAHIRASKSPKPGTVLHLSKNIDSQQLGFRLGANERVEGVYTQYMTDGERVCNNAENSSAKSILVTVQSKQGHLYQCSVEQPLLPILESIGHIPLPPYIQRSAEHEDISRYQTVYAKAKGSVAAPTAGLHFDETVLKKLADHGVEFAFTTLHVGAGTFQPVRSEYISEHQMHSEWMEVSQASCDLINQAKAQGRRIIAVGSTALRTLESAAKSGKLEPYTGETQIFITPGYSFQVVDGLLTNFHLPESTLLMMVAAFIGYAPMMKLYEEAIANEYRFFSYGDVSLLL